MTKTGTSSLHRALALLGFDSFHWGGRSAYHAVLDAQGTGHRLLHDVGEQHDAYSEIGTLSVRFDLADLQYPGSCFILTVCDVDQWVDGRRRHAERNNRDRVAGRYQGSNLDIDEDQWREQWATHLDRVLTWFAGRDNLLVLDVCRGEGWERLAPFLDKPIPATRFPGDAPTARGIASARRSLQRAPASSGASGPPESLAATSSK